MQKKTISTGKKIITILALIGLIGIFAYSFIDVKNQREILLKHGKTTKAVVIRKYLTHRAKSNIEYRFEIDNKSFYGHRLYYNKVINLSDTFKVIYYPIDPDINEILLKKKDFEFFQIPDSSNYELIQELKQIIDNN